MITTWNWNVFVLFIDISRTRKEVVVVVIAQTILDFLGFGDVFSLRLRCLVDAFPTTPFTFFNLNNNIKLVYIYSVVLKNYISISGATSWIWTWIQTLRTYPRSPSLIIITASFHHHQLLLRLLKTLTLT